MIFSSMSLIFFRTTGNFLLCDQITYTDAWGSQNS